MRNLHRLSKLGLLTLIFSALFGFSTAIAAPEVCPTKPKTDKAIHVIGCLTDRRGDQEKPVAGAKIRISVNDKLIGTTTSNKTGLFDLKLPIPATELVGKAEIKVELDLASLPAGTSLIEPATPTLVKTLTLADDLRITFPIGAAVEKTSTAVKALQLAVGGITFSLILALASLGMSLIFGTTGLSNFAHGEMITFGALAGFFVDRLPGEVMVGDIRVTMFAGIFAALITTALFGWLQDKVLWKPLRNKGVGLIAAMIVSIGLSIFLRNLYQYFAGPDNQNYSQWTTPEPWHWGPVLITPKELAVSLACILVLLVTIFWIQKTKIGKATRAVADNPALAASSGINVNKVISTVWLIGGGLAGLAGVFLGMTQGFNFQIGFKILLLVFAAVVLGGLGSIWGALLGSLLIGILIEVSTLLIPLELKFVGALVLLIGILLVRPQGLLGRPERIG